MDNSKECLKIIFDYYGIVCFSNPTQEKCEDLLDLAKTAEKFGLKSKILSINIASFFKRLNQPAIILYKGALVVVWEIKRRLGKVEVQCESPEYGKFLLTDKDIIDCNNIESEIEILLFENTLAKNYLHGTENKLFSWSSVLQYFWHHKRALAVVFVALLLNAVIQLIFPFLTQSIVDVGIKLRDLNFINVVLVGYLTLIISRTIADYIRSITLLQVSSVVNLSIISDFWLKLSKLPLIYFSRKNAGEILQHIEDNRYLHNFLSGSTINTFFSFINFLIFSFYLILFDARLFGIFIIGMLAYFFWIRMFMKYRKILNKKIFDISSQERNATIEMIQGVTDLRLNNIELIKRWIWEDWEEKLYRLKLKNFSISQIQFAGATLINQLKDIFLVFLVSRLVIYGELSLGSMIALQYIIGQLNGPIDQFIYFLQDFQTAKVSLERLNKVYNMPEENNIYMQSYEAFDLKKDIIFNNVNFGYGESDLVLNNISTVIRNGKVTAIVGPSGSGKSTILKLLLKIYRITEGEIKIGSADFEKVDCAYWRNSCGAVLQDSHIFNDTIAGNISLGYRNFDKECIQNAARLANISDFIESLPQGYNTVLGSDGVSLSFGQIQRILIARLIYRNPDVVILDEPTSSLDMLNENILINNLKNFFKDKTVIIAAHRLNTINSADKIIVLSSGNIVEEGNHASLMKDRGFYYRLFRNQFEY